MFASSFLVRYKLRQNITFNLEIEDILTVSSGLLILISEIRNESQSSRMRVKVLTLFTIKVMILAIISVLVGIFKFNSDF